MKINTLKIREEFKELIAKSNSYLNANNKQQAVAYLYVIFSLVALSFFGLFAIGPTITTITRLNQQFKEDNEALEKLKEKNSALQSLSAQYIDIQNDLPAIENAIPQSPKIAELTRQLESLTIKNDLVVQKLDTGLLELYPAKNTNSSLFSFTFTIGVQGEESDVNAFIADLVNMGRIIGIERLTTGRQQGTYTASITGRAFYYRE